MTVLTVYISTMLCSVDVDVQSSMTVCAKYATVNTALLNPLQVPCKCSLKGSQKLSGGTARQTMESSRRVPCRWASPIVLVKKISSCFYVDYRKHNSLMKNDAYTSLTI